LHQKEATSSIKNRFAEYGKNNPNAHSLDYQTSYKLKFISELSAIKRQFIRCGTIKTLLSPLLFF